MLIGVLSAHSWTQAQSSPPTNEVMIDIDTTASWEKIKKKKTHLALKTNLLYAATLTPNLGLEIGITPQISLNIVGSYNPWNREGKKGDNDMLEHWLVQPEVRYWLLSAFMALSQNTISPGIAYSACSIRTIATKVGEQESESITDTVGHSPKDGA